MSGADNETDDLKVMKADIELARKLVAQFQDDDFDCERISFELACHRRAALSPSAPEAPSEQGRGGWQPISTHPRDGKKMHAVTRHGLVTEIWANPELDQSLYLWWFRLPAAPITRARQPGAAS